MPDEFLVQWRSERGGGAAPSFNSVPTSVVGKSIKIIYVERQLWAASKPSRLALGIPKYLHATVLVYIRKCKCIYA